MLKIGRIPYTNLFPIYYYLKQRSQGRYGFIDGVPSVVNKLLREGRVDVSPSSSIEYLRSPEKYILIQGHSISSEGPVGSIILFSKAPIEQLAGRTILYSYHSETSVALLQVIMRKFLDLRCNMVSSSAPLQEGLQTHQAYLMIGDNALKESLSRPDLKKYDLGEIWYRKTGLPFVYALWIRRRATGDIKHFIKDLDDSRSKAIENLSGLAGHCPAGQWLSEENLTSYWRGISYNLCERHMEGLALFRKYLVELEML